MDQFGYNQYSNYQSSFSQENTQKQIDSLNLQIFFLVVALFAICISIYVIEGFKDLIINGKNARHTQEELHDYAVLSSTLTTIVTIYFLYLAFTNYKSNNTASNGIYLLVGVLVSIASLVRLATLAATPFGQATANEIF